MPNGTEPPKNSDPYQDLIEVGAALRNVRILLKHLGKPEMQKILAEMGLTPMLYRRQLVFLEKRLSAALDAPFRPWS